LHVVPIAHGVPSAYVGSVPHLVIPSDHAVALF